VIFCFAIVDSRRLDFDCSLREILEIGGMKCRMAVNYEDAESADDEPPVAALQYRARQKCR
jgi:hypothetical protein